MAKFLLMESNPWEIIDHYFNAFYMKKYPSYKKELYL